jgi:hypothetical protein
MNLRHGLLALGHDYNVSKHNLATLKMATPKRIPILALVLCFLVLSVA